MKKTVIYVTRKPRFSYMNFRVVGQSGDCLLFTMPYNKNVYQFFEKGKSISQLRKFNKWKKKDVLSGLIENRLPYEINKLRKGGVLIDE